MTEMGNQGEKYATAKTQRQEAVDAILQSKATKKVVVAGPGTGKTYLFKLALKEKPNSLTLTFINSLVQDLSLELCGLSEVRTLHGFARSTVSKTGGNAQVYPPLPGIIKQDAQILKGESCDFEHMLFEMDEQNALFEFYSQRRKYYDHYGHSDLVYAAVKHFQASDHNIPVYQQVVIDEFQDFNKLEVSLVQLLARKSPLLLAGDDDQALYDFKKASPTHIREWHGKKGVDQESFSLPYCSRCTRVIVDSANDIITSATKAGLLKGRIDKGYKYFDDKDKDRECDAHTTLSYSQWYAAQIPWFIGKSITEIAEELKSKFSVLVIAPTTTQCRQLTKTLKQKGFTNVSGIEAPAESKTQLVDGLKILIKDNGSNLGWRLILEEMLSAVNFTSLLKKAADEDSDLVTVVSKEEKERVMQLVKTAKKIVAGNAVEEDALDQILSEIGIDPYRTAKDQLAAELTDRDSERVDASVRNIPITVTTVQRSKGLAADFVFITYFDDQYFIRDRDKTVVSDHDTCSFLVALTRARRKAYLVSSRKQTPTFLRWMDKRRYE